MSLLIAPALLLSACASSHAEESEPDEPCAEAACETTSAEPGDGETQTVTVSSQGKDGESRVIRVQDGGKVIVLPAGGAEIEGGGPIRFEKGGRVIRLDGDVRVLVDGQAVQGTEVKPGQDVEVRDADGKRIWVIRGRGDGGEKHGARYPISAYADANGAYSKALSDIVTDGSRTYWLDANKLQTFYTGQAPKGSYSVSGTDGHGPFVIRIEDGKIASAEVDGKPIPKDQIEQDGSRVRIKSKDGSGDLELTLPSTGGLFRKSRQGPQGYLGVHTTRPDDALAEQLGLDPDGVEIVSAVVEDGPAARGGIQAHDIITKVDGESPMTSQRLGEIVRAKKPGEKVQIRVLRKGQPVDLSIALGDRPEGERPGLDVLKSLGYAGGQNTEAWRDAWAKAAAQSGADAKDWRELVRPLRAAQGSDRNESIQDLVTRLEDQNRRLEEQLERLEQQQRELQQLEERLRKLGQKEPERR